MTIQHSLNKESDQRKADVSVKKRMLPAIPVLQESSHKTLQSPTCWQVHPEGNTQWRKTGLLCFGYTGP